MSSDSVLMSATINDLIERDDGLSVVALHPPARHLKLRESGSVTLAFPAGASPSG
jgi:hypothetical protein